MNHRLKTATMGTALTVLMAFGLYLPGSGWSISHKQLPESAPAVGPSSSAAQTVMDAPTAEDALHMALSEYLKATAAQDYRITQLGQNDDDAFAVAEPFDPSTGSRMPVEAHVLLLAKRAGPNTWTAAAPNLIPTRDFNAHLRSLPDDLIDPGGKAFLQLPEPSGEISALNFSGYKLPWQYQQTSQLKAKGNCYLYNGNVYCDNTGHDLQLDWGVQGSGVAGDIIAAKPGTVVFVKESSNSGGCGYQYWQQANMVVIQHGTNEYSWYVHLAYNSVPVTVGQSVGFGTKVGVEGATGYACGTHLHFMASTGRPATWPDPNNPNVAPWASGITAVDFSEVSWDGLTVAHWYASQNTGGGGDCPGPSLNSPSDGFVSSSQTISFSWSPPSGCTFEGYTFRIKDTSNMDSGGTTIVDTGNSLTSRTETIPSQWNNRDLYWGVRTANPLSPNWSVWRFRIEPGGGGCNPNSDQIALFMDPDYGGSCVTKGIGDHTNPGAIGLANDSISSVKVGGNVKVTLCEHDNYEGTCETFTGDDSNLSDNSIGNDRVSSAKVESRGSTCTNGAIMGALQPGYTYCAEEGGVCSFNGQASVAYGANSCYFYENFTDTAACNNDTFGDPLVGTHKACHYKLLSVLTLTASPNVVSPGGGVMALWSGFSPTGNDWISLHPAGQPDSGYLSWQYATGASGSLTFRAPSTPGVYEFRLFRNAAKVATSNTFQVTATTARLRSIGSQDGWVLESCETCGTGGTLETSAPLRVGDNLQDQQFRSTLSFNTASIPDGAVITKVTFKVKRYTIVGINPCTTYGNLLMDVRRGSFSGNPALQRTDFHAYSNAGAAVPCAASNGWYTKVWPSGLVNYINKTGLTQLRLRFSRDDNDDLSADYLNFYSGDYGTTSYRPQLIIEYYVP